MKHTFIPWYYGVYNIEKRKWMPKLDGNPERCVVCSWVRSHPYHQ